MAGKNRGRVTIPTDLDVIPETLEIMELWGADALRDCDGTQFPEQLKNTGAKIYATYYTTRKDNEWARANPDEIQQCYIMTDFHLAESKSLSIPLMQGISKELMKPNDQDDVKRWWEVIDRTTGEIVPASIWSYNNENGMVHISQTIPYHEYTVSFLAYLIWDPVHMYNAVVNDWKDFEHQLTFDVRQPKTRAYSIKRLRQFIESNPHVDVLRFTTFFHQFTLVFDELKREKYVDWYGYSASVSPYILEQFEKEAGYAFRPEFIIDQGYYNNQYRIPTREYKDFMSFQRREVAKLAKEMVDITHEYGKEAMMFLGDHFIGTEPYMEEFSSIGLDAVVGSVGNASTLRLISDIKGVRYTEGRFLPYFFPDTFYPGGDPTKEARENWIQARRALLRKPVDRIGYGGYLKLAYDFTGFTEYVKQVTDEYRKIYQNIEGAVPYCIGKIGVLNCWGKMRSWGCHMVHHALYQKKNYSYAGVFEALAGMPFEVNFFSFDDIVEDETCLEHMDVLLVVGDGDTAHTGGICWENPKIAETIRRFVYSGKGMIGIGEPGGHQYQGRYLQLSNILGVEKETGMTLGYDKYNWKEHTHFILVDCDEDIDFGEGGRSMYALPDAKVLIQREKEVCLAVNQAGFGRSVYISGLPYNLMNTRLLYRSLIWAAGKEEELCTWYSTNYHIEIHAYPEKRKYCAVNNTNEVQETTIYDENGSASERNMKPGEIQWFIGNSKKQQS